MKPIASFGNYLILLSRVFSKPENLGMYWKRFIYESNSIGVASLGIVAIISVFVGAVTCVNTAYQLFSGFVPRSIIGSIVSDSSILELSPTITCLVLAGKIGSNIATELGSMRVQEEIDAMEVMGVNSAALLILPKIVASFFTIPILIIISMFLSIYGGYFIGGAANLVTNEDFISGARSTFRPYTFYFAMIKTYTFAFIISSISSFQGYYAGGSSIEVGKASTRAVVYSCIFILFADYILAQLLL